MRTTLDLPDETFRKLKAEAALRSAKLKDLITQFIEDGLAEHSTRTVPARPKSTLPMLRQPTGTLHPAMSNAEVENFLTLDDAHDRH